MNRVSMLYKIEQNEREAPWPRRKAEGRGALNRDRLLRRKRLSLCRAVGLTFAPETLTINVKL